MNSPKNFKDFGITIEHKAFTGDKIKMSKVLNKEITVYGFKLVDSKFEGKGKCLHMQIGMQGSMYVLFTGSAILTEMIQKVPKDHFPFITTIIEENERFQFT